MKPGKSYLISGILVMLMALLLVSGYRSLTYNWQWYRVWPYFISSDSGVLVAGVLTQGLVITLKISCISLILSLIIGVVTAFCRLSCFVSLRALSWTYVEIIRNTPLLIQIFIMYFVISPVLGLSAFASAVIALSLFEGAYSSEIIRSGIVNISPGQIEAAQSIGLPTPVIYYRIILPQMLRQTLPMLAGQGVSLIKDSALVSTISIYDLTLQAQKVVSETFLTFEIWFAVALCYLMITASLSCGIRQIEKRVTFIQ